ncbi:hypothetical protein FTX61_26110, partial [Nitriliruptoraceae bacterium ZYF776]|nr:hypothetical protein [Profundirhabdus halotolerans]
MDLPEAFYWSRLQDDTTGELTSSHDHFPVYPLFQSSVGNLNDIWIALSTDTSASLTPKQEELMHGFRLPQAGTIAERGVLFWFSKAQASKGLVVSCDTKVAEVSPTKE